MAAVEGELAAAGFRNVCKDLLYAYVPEGAGSMAALRELDVRIPLYNPDYATQRFQAREILKLRPNNLPSDMDFLAFIGTFAVPGERDFEIREAHDPSKRDRQSCGLLRCGKHDRRPSRLERSTTGRSKAASRILHASCCENTHAIVQADVPQRPPRSTSSRCATASPRRLDISRILEFS